MAAPYITAAVPKITDAAAKEKAGQPEIALPLYIQAIEALLVGASADTNAKRVDAIRTKVDRWLQAAEGIDASLEVAASGRLQALLAKLEREQPPAPPPSMGGYGGGGGGGGGTAMLAPMITVESIASSKRDPQQQYAVGDLPAPMMPTTPGNPGNPGDPAGFAPGAPPEPSPGPSGPAAPVGANGTAVFAPSAPGAPAEPYPGPSGPVAPAAANGPPLLPGFPAVSFPAVGTVDPWTPTAPPDLLTFDSPPGAGMGAGGLLKPTRAPPQPPASASAPLPAAFAGRLPTAAVPPAAYTPQYATYPQYTPGQPAPGAPGARGSPSSGRASLYADLSHGLGGPSNMPAGGGGGGGTTTTFPTASNPLPPQPGPHASGGPPAYSAAMLNSDIPVIFEPVPPHPTPR